MIGLKRFGRVAGLPPYWARGGRRIFSLLVDRDIYNPEFLIRRKGGLETVRPMPPNQGCPKVPQFFTRQTPDKEPPAHGTKGMFITGRVRVPAATYTVVVDPQPGDPISFYDSGVYIDGGLYTVPNGYMFEAKKFLISCDDTDYEDITFVPLKNNGEAFVFEGAPRKHTRISEAEDHELTYSGGAGYQLLPLLPQDQFNMILRYKENERVGIKITNLLPSVRFVDFAIWGWKYPVKCFYNCMGVY